MFIKKPQKKKKLFGNKEGLVTFLMKLCFSAVKILEMLNFDEIEDRKILCLWEIFYINFQQYRRN